ncbi:probable cytochrome P450 6a23 [Zophobas morio]
MSKDFQHFVDRGFYYNEKDDPLSAHLFSIGGQKWRNLRTKLTPTFTSGKMKMMFPTVVECEGGLQKRIEEESLKNEPINIKELLARFTTDVIGSCAFGLNCDTFSDENSPFRVYGQKILTASAVETLKRLIAFNFPDIAHFLSLTVTPKDVDKFFRKMVTDTVNHREKNDVIRKDFMQLLIDLKNNKLAEEDGYKHDGKTLTLEEIAAQSVVFFVAGFETSSTTMAFALYELSKHQYIQDKVRHEINTVLAKHDNKITYEAIQEMKYMDQVIDETLRKYPPVSFLTRECVRDYKHPDDDIVIEKGTTVVIPTLGLHYDEDYFPDAEKFDPERFSEENKNSRHRYVYIPFGEGPRMCIGMRFGIMQSKVGLAALLRSHIFTLNAKTQEPFEWRADSFVLAVEGDIWLNAQKV